MKKHPVDDLFNRKLSEIERKPSAAAWERLSQPNKKMHKPKAIWMWYAAAGVVMVLLAGYLVWMNRAATVIPQMAEITRSTTIPQDSVQVRTLTKVEVPTRKTDEHVKKNQGEKTFVAASVVSEKKLDAVEDKFVIADIETTEPKKMELALTVEIPEPVTGLNATAPLALNKINDESRTIIVKVDEPTDIYDEKPKTTRFKRILGQLKNAKQGERVDWEEVGFNPKSLVARVDDKLKNGEEKVTEKYQNLKERTKL